jgi:hypothetical protein
MKVFVLCFLIVCVIFIGVFFATPSTQGQKEQKDEATVVQRGQLTEKEKEYSKEYTKLYSYRNGRKLTEATETEKLKARGKETGFSLGVPSVPTIGDIPTTSSFLGDLSCKADAIVLGSAQNKSAHLTEDETFIYTEYEFSVKDILKNNSVSPIEVNNNIQITRPGGLIKLDDQLIRVEDKLYETLQIKKTYLLFLRFIPSANGYIVSDANGDFSIENNSFKELSKLGLPTELKNKSSETLLNEVHNAISIDCSKYQQGEK